MALSWVIVLAWCIAVALPMLNGIFLGEMRRNLRCLGAHHGPALMEEITRPPRNSRNRLKLGRPSLVLDAAHAKGGNVAKLQPVKDSLPAVREETEEHKNELPTAGDQGKLVDAKTLLCLLWEETSRPSLRWLREQQKRRAIPFIKVGARVWFQPSEVQRHLQEKWTVRRRQSELRK